MATATTAPRYRGASAVYVTAWNVISRRLGIRQTIYSQEIAVDRIAAGWDVESCTIVHHDDGRREYLDGTVAPLVYAYREGRAPTVDDRTS
jgi:hypothetical protein